MNETLKTPQNIELNNMLNEEELKKLTELLGQNSVLLNNNNTQKKGKKSKMTPQEKNKILSQLTTHQTIQENYKPINEMSDMEKQSYRNALLEKLHKKRSMFKQNRTNHKVLQKQYDEQIKKMTKEDDKKEENISNILQMAKPVEHNEEDKIKDDILDDYIE